MNHPSKKILQDFFENELKQQLVDRVKTHTGQCHQCSNYLEFLAKSNVQLRNEENLSISNDIKGDIFANAFSILDQRIEHHEAKEFKRESRKNKVKEVTLVKDRFFNSELVTIAKFASVASVFIFFIAINSFKTVNYEYQKVNTEVTEYTNTEARTYTDFGEEIETLGEL